MQMNVRKDIQTINEIPNIGPAIARDLALLNILTPSELIGKDPYKMYDDLCQITGSKHDPCVIDVFLAVIDFMEGADPVSWWKYTAERKKHLNRDHKE